MISDKRPVQDLLSLLKAHGISDVVISPGSRNAPLSISFDADDHFRCYPVIDERCAGFFALGIAQQSRQAVVLVCTSGSAALNFAPAVAEAFYQHIPLIVVTADRPAEWIDQGDGQTIRQDGVFGRHVSYNASLWHHSDDEDLAWHNRRMINEAVLVSRKGTPVHLNMPFRESLYGKVDMAFTRQTEIRDARTAAMVHPDELARFTQKIAGSKKVLILASMLNPDPELNEHLGRLAGLPNVAVLTETTSNLHHPAFISCIDRLIMSFSAEEEQDFRPDLLLTIGTQLISKKIKALLRKLKPEEHWHISEEETLVDTFQSLSHRIRVSPRTFFSQLPDVIAPGKSEYSAKLQNRNALNSSNGRSYLNDAPWSDFKAFELILPRIPQGHNLQMGNSSVVRYIQLFDARKDLRYNGNRGTSGIDGCTSTACGAAWHRNSGTTLISGDVAFLYDSNALWANPISRHLRMIVINNGGGGIFRIIEGPRQSGVLEKYFETRHQLNMKPLAAHAGIRYRQASDAEGLIQGLDWLYKGRKAGLLEVFTPSTENAQVLKEFFQFLQKKASRT